jgi:hypothetical protein
VNAGLLDLAALVLVSLEWLGLGWLSGVSFPEAPAPRHLRQVANAAVRLLVGAFLVAVAQLLLAQTGIGFGSIPLVLVLAAVGALGLRGALRWRAPARCPAKLQPLQRREVLGWLLLGLLLLASLGRSLVVPEAGWDAFSHWGLRAQAFALAGTLVNAHSEHEYYPPLVPLLEAWLYAHRGSISIDLGKTIWAVLGSGFAVCLGWHLRLSLRSAWLAPYLAIGIVLATPGLLEGFWTGQADLALTAYLSMATLAAWQWHQAADRRWLIQAAVFGAAAALCKFEGLPRVALVCGALALDGVLARNWRAYAGPAVCLLFGGVAAWLAWTLFELSHGIAANGEHTGPPQPEAIGSVIVALVAVFFGLRTGGGLLVAAAAWVLSARAVVAPPLRALSLVVVAQALATLVAFLVSTTAPDVEVLTAATRLVEQFLPIALFVGAVGLTRVGNL